MLRIALLSASLLTACDQSTDATPVDASAPPAGHPTVTSAPSQAASQPAASGQVEGTVLEKMDAGGYSYVLLDTAQGEQWAAVQQAPIGVGQDLTLTDATPMTGFHSKTLDRTFDVILFAQLGSSTGVGHGGRSATPGAEVAEAVASVHQGLTDVDLNLSSPVEKAAGADGRTVAEVHAQAAELEGQAVAVSGKVVKFNPDILGANWVHLRDGSGTAEAGDHDLTMTIDTKVAVGDVITVRGTVARNKDFGAGYRYDVIVEGGVVDR